MKKKHIVSLLMMLILSLGISRICEAKQGLLGNTFRSMEVYYGAGKLLGMQLKLNITIATPQGVYYGVYNATSLDIGDTIPNESWSGPGSAPVLKVVNYRSADASNCPGIDTTKFGCRAFNFDVTVNQDDGGCPWLAALSAYSYFPDSGGAYTGPTSRGSICPTVPVDTYDISWNPNFVQHDKVLSIMPTGGTVNQTLPTYLMESGTLCDGSKFDDRGAYCRFVATGITLTVLGCDNNIVTTTAVAHPITDKELHDINVAVNTKNVGTGTVTSTCNFQYIIEQL